MKNKKRFYVTIAALAAVIVLSIFVNYQIGCIRDEQNISGDGPFAIGSIWWVIPAAAMALLIVTVILEVRKRKP